LDGTRDTPPKGVRQRLSPFIVLMAAIKLPIMGGNSTIEEHIAEPTHGIDLRGALKYITMIDVFLYFPCSHIQLQG
jgi:hypothetical protein